MPVMECCVSNNCFTNYRKKRQLLLKCVDTDASGTGAGLLDFDVAIAWDQSEGGTPLCNPNSTSTWPVPGAPSKCWKAETRFNVPVEVPPWNTPSAQPSISTVPSASPTESQVPSSSPSKSSMPSDSPSVSSAPSGMPSLSTSPSESPSRSMMPSSNPSR
jgi:hypothetical protein